MTPDLVERTFDLPCRIIEDPETGAPLIIPLARATSRAVRTDPALG
jgi:iron complex transport system ATP-binding protein